MSTAAIASKATPTTTTNYAEQLPSSTFSTRNLSEESPLTTYSSPKSSKSSPQQSYLPNQFSYYSEFLNKSQFNLILINSSIKLLEILYSKNSNPSICKYDEQNLKFFIVEILRRSKTSTQSLQLACFYVAKLINSGKLDQIKFGPKKLFLTLIILGSKFNQDHNYSFKSWLKICGVESSNTTSNLSLKELKSLEMETLGLLNYELYLNNLNYENWCNILMIFSYDFIKIQKIIPAQSGSQLEFESNTDNISQKLLHWGKVYQGLNFKLLNSLDIQFKSYFTAQLGNKIIIQKEVQVPSLFGKRCFENEDNYIAKKVKV